MDYAKQLYLNTRQSPALALRQEIADKQHSPQRDCGSFKAAVNKANEVRK